MRSPVKTTTVTALVALVLALTGCGGGDSGGNSSANDGGSAQGSAGNGMTVQEALLVELDAPTLVTGYLIEDGGTLKLCESLMESEPPQCGEPSLTIKGGTLDDQPRGELVDVRGVVANDALDVAAEGDTGTG